MTPTWMERSKTFVLPLVAKIQTSKCFFALSDNSSLQVDFREFMLALCVMRTGTAEENLKQIFRAFDVNSDGKVAILLIWKL